MRIEMQINPNTPLSLVTFCIDQLAESMKLFGVGDCVVTYAPGEEERLLDTERNRVLRIRK